MKALEFKMSFATPAFVGDANQTGGWRTPPIKALLRQWWRVATASRSNYNYRSLLDCENQLFGHGGDSARKSKLRVRIDSWSAAELVAWPPGDGKVFHPEVNRPISPELYLGYGPLNASGGTVLQPYRSAISTTQTAVLRLAYPETDAADMEVALRLVDWFGTIGGRSRNGWGSLSIDLLSGSLDQSAFSWESVTRSWEQCLGSKSDWPHAIGLGNDGSPLVWSTTTRRTWRETMKDLAQIKIKLRTLKAFEFKSGKRASAPESRHWLSYPVTHHDVIPWDREKLRLPNTLRFKVRRSDGGFKGIIFHMPCMPIADFRPNEAQLIEVWRTVHQFLNDQPKAELSRVAL